MANHIAEYCEAYLITNGLCKIGSKCCIPLDNNTDKSSPDLRIPKNDTVKPTKTVTSTNLNSQRPKLPPSKPNTNRPTKPQEPSRESIEGNQINHRPCDGECVSGLFALFCDSLDEDAFCPNEGSCCIASENNANNAPATTPKPVSNSF